MLALTQGSIILLASLPLGVFTLPLSDDHGVDIQDRYIVTLKPGVSLDSHINEVNAMHALACSQSGDKPFQGVSHQYNISEFRGYAGQFAAPVISQLNAHDDVENIEPDSVWETAAAPEAGNPRSSVPLPKVPLPKGPKMPGMPSVPLLPKILTQANAPWGLNQISHRGADKEHKGYTYDSSAGRGSYAYVIDTGIDIHHKEFENRAYDGYREFPNMKFVDTDGHGTMVAGVIAGKTYGVAKRARLVNVKVMDKPKGPFRAVLAGIDWAVKDITTHKRFSRAVINLSLTGPHSASINKAIDSAFKLGITTVAAAGDGGKDVSESSPGSARQAIAVASTDELRKRASDSNYGSGVTLFAPGVNIPSAAIGEGNEASHTGSGTGLAAAHVTGIAIYFQTMMRYPDIFAVKRFLTSVATPKVVHDTKGSPNLFAYNNGGQ